MYETIKNNFSVFAEWYDNLKDADHLKEYSLVFPSDTRKEHAKEFTFDLLYQAGELTTNKQIKDYLKNSDWKLTTCLADDDDCTEDYQEYLRNCIRTKVIKDQKVSF